MSFCLSNNYLTTNFSNYYNYDNHNYLGNELNECENIWMIDDIYGKNINNKNNNININNSNYNNLFTMYC